MNEGNFSEGPATFKQDRLARGNINSRITPMYGLYGFLANLVPVQSIPSSLLLSVPFCLHFKDFWRHSAELSLCNWRGH